MSYFLDNIGMIFLAACFVSVAAVIWWYLNEKNAELKRQRAKARMKAAEKIIEKDAEKETEDNKD